VRAREVEAIEPRQASIHRRSLSDVNRRGILLRRARRAPVYGRLIEQVRPREAMPAEGDVVAVVGAAFERNTTFSFEGNP